MGGQRGDEAEAYKKLESVLDTVEDDEMSYHLRTVMQLMKCKEWK